MTALQPNAIGTELLDDPGADPGAVAESLRNIARANRWFGGAAAVRWGLGRALASTPRGARVTLLDLGTGLGDLPLAARGWAAGRGIDLMPLGLERSPVAARGARAAGLAVVLADAAQPPVAERSADIVLLSQVAHHFDPESAVRLFRLADRMARQAVVVADLHRAPLATALYPLGARLLRFDRATLHDGAVSIRRGFSVSELGDLLRRAGARARVARRPGWRLVAVWRPLP